MIALRPITVDASVVLIGLISYINKKAIRSCGLYPDSLPKGGCHRVVLSSAEKYRIITYCRMYNDKLAKWRRQNGRYISLFMTHEALSVNSSTSQLTLHD